MHDYVLGFVCFMAGATFVVAVGFIALGRRSKEHPSVAGPVTDLPPVEPERRPWREADPHLAWPECDCPSEAFHTKYYPWAGVS